MRCSVHADALKSVFDGLANVITAPSVLSAKLGVTQEIVQNYHLILGENQHFQAWFAAAQIQNRLLIRSTHEAPSTLNVLDGEARFYGVASYFSASRLFLNSDARISAAEREAFFRLGIDVLNPCEPLNPAILSENPVASLSFFANGRVDFDVFDSLIAAEEKIVFYDKYIDESGLQLIEHVVSRLPSNSLIYVRTTSLGANCKSVREIDARIKAANPSVISCCKEVSVNFRKRAHDRYLFLGNRLQVVFTAGIGCFGLRNNAGERSNKQSKINVYSIDGGAILDIEASDGTVLSTPYVDSL